MGCAHYRHQSRGLARGRKPGPEAARQKARAAPNLLKCFVFQHFYAARWASTRFFIKSSKSRAPTAVARLVCAEVIASETPEQLLSTNVEKSCFFALKRDEINQNSVRHESPYTCGSEGPPATPKIFVLHWHDEKPTPQTARLLTGMSKKGVPKMMQK